MAVRDGDGESIRTVRVARAWVAELESTKLEAMRSAVELASALLGVDGVLVDER